MNTLADGQLVPAAPGQPEARAGRNELGTISIADGVVSKIAAWAAAEDADAGAAAVQVLGRPLPGATLLPVRSTDLGSLPKTTVDVDGSKAYVSLEISVRWPASVTEVTSRLREHVRARVKELAGLDVDEVHIVVADLATDIAAPSRVR